MTLIDPATDIPPPIGVDPRHPDQEDTALAALAALIGLQGVSVDAAQLRHNLGHARAPNGADLVRLARQVPRIRAKYLTGQSGKMDRLPLPVMARMSFGWVLVGAAAAGTYIVQRPGAMIEPWDENRLAQHWSGEVLLLTERKSAASAGHFDLRWFLPQIVRYRKPIGEVLLITLALNLLGLASPMLFQNVIDKVLAHNSMTTLMVLTIGLFAVALWEVMFGWIRTRVFSETSQKIDVELGARIFRHMLALPLSYFEARRVGDTVTRVRQIETIREFLANASLTVLVDPLFTLVFLVAMAFYSPALTGIVILSLIAYAAISLLVTGPMRRALDDKFNEGAASNALLVESVSAIQTVKASAIEPQWQHRWERQLAAYSAASQRAINLGNLGSESIQLISKLSFVALLFFGAKAVIAGTLSVGGLVAFNMFAQRVSGPVLRMAQLWNEFQQVRVAVERMGDLLNATPESAVGNTTSGQAQMPRIQGHIAFEHVHFAYGPDLPAVLENVHLQIEPGMMLGIVGSSGSGKSTLTKLLQRLYAPSQGRVLIDDIDIADVDAASLRRQIGVVLQENILFNQSVRENISLAHPALPPADIVAAAKLAGAHDFITRLPQGYDTLLVERGANLSGGQRQRIAIARALAADPRILLLDEATSALDAESEEIVQANLRDMAVGRTVVIIAHRLSAVRSCDRIIVMEQGRIVEAGGHEALLSIGGRYADLHARQTGLAPERKAA
ncbi:MAG: type I secretion system permease/ATPase [Sphingomonadaceae bacterium]